MGKLFRRIAYGLVAVGAAGALVLALRPRPVPVDLGVVDRGHLEVTVDEDGRTRLKERYIVSSPLAGLLLRIELKPGDGIVAGETVLTAIEPTDPGLLDVRAVAEAEMRVNASEAAVRRTEQELIRANAALELAQVDEERVRKAYASGAATDQERDQASLMTQTRLAERRAAEFSREIASFELGQARAALLRTRSDADRPPDTSRFLVHAPITGRVLRVFQESAGVVSAGTALIEVGDPGNIELEVDVLSTDAVRIRPGARVVVEHWGGESDLSGVVRIVEPSGFTKISALGVEEQRVNVIIDLIDPPEKRPALGDGFRVEVRVLVWEGEDVLRVPVSALFRVGREWAVFVERSGRAQRVAVEIGRMNQQHAELLAGLAPGDRIVLYPSDRVEEGVRIRERFTTPLSP